MLRTTIRRNRTPWIVGLVCLAMLPGCWDANGPGDGKRVRITNVSYDPTREFYADFNQAFAEYWLAKTGVTVEVDQSHGGSGKQARAVIEGLPADVVSLALAGDIGTIAKQSGLIDSQWHGQLPHNSAPYTSTIVFLVRKGNPKQIRDWGDLIQKNVEIIAPNPKTGGGARWIFMAAWGYSVSKELGGLASIKDPSKSAEVAAANAKAKEFLSQMYRRVPVLDSGARGATNTFIQRGIGDVLLTWENEAFLAIKEVGADAVEVVVPPLSILAEPPVAVVSKNAEKHGTLDVSKAYLEYLYSEVGQGLAAKHFYRPRKTDGLSERDLQKFPKLSTFELTDLVSGWEQAHETHFNDGGTFDQIYQAN